MDVRCGQCATCKRVDEERRIYLAKLSRYEVTRLAYGTIHCTPVQGSATEDDRLRWNQTLVDNPCEEWAKGDLQAPEMPPPPPLKEGQP